MGAGTGLEGHRAPPSTTCTFTDKTVSAATETLQPGIYCGGLTVTNGATVTLSPGTFIFRDGPLVVDGASSFKGTDVSIYMKGLNANLTFATASTIHLTAAKSGPLSGILIYDDPTGTAKDDITVELERMSSQNDVELELARLKGEIGAGKAPDAIEAGSGSSGATPASTGTAPATPAEPAKAEEQRP